MGIYIGAQMGMGMGHEESTYLALQYIFAFATEPYTYYSVRGKKRGVAQLSSSQRVFFFLLVESACREQIPASSTRVFTTTSRRAERERNGGKNFLFGSQNEKSEYGYREVLQLITEVKVTSTVEIVVISGESEREKERIKESSWKENKSYVFN